MSQDMISFGCPSCEVQLRVPSSMAGVQGPCPACGAPISAPQPDPEPSPEPAAQPVPSAPAAREEPPAPAAAPASPGSGFPTDPFPSGYESPEPRSEPAPVSAYLDDPFASPPLPSPPPSVPRDPFGSGPITPFPGGAPLPRPADPAPCPPLREQAETLPAAPSTPIPSDPFQAPAPAPAPAPGPAPVGLPDPSAPSPVPSNSPTGGPVPTAAIDPLAPPPQAPASLDEQNQFPSAPSNPGGLFSSPPAKPPPDPFPVAQNQAEGNREPLPNLGPATIPSAPGGAPQLSFPAPHQRPTRLDPYGDPFMGSLELGEVPRSGDGGTDPSGFPSSPLGPPSSYPVPSAPSANDLSGALSSALGQFPPVTPLNPGPAPSAAPPPAAADSFPAIPSIPPAPAPAPLRKPGDLSPESILPLTANHPHYSPMAPPVQQAASEPSGPSRRIFRRLRWPGIVFPLLFLVLAAIMVYLVLDLSELLPNSKVHNVVPSDKPGPSPRTEPHLQARETPRPSPIIPAEFNRGTPSPSRSNPDPITMPPPDPTTPRRSVIEDEDRHVEGEVPVAPLIDLDATDPTSTNPSPRAPSPPPDNSSDNSRPAQVLEKFLAARTLEERLPYLTRSHRSDTVLAGSALARPLPEVVHRRRVPYVQDASSKQIEHFFEISFQMSPNQIPSPILVQLNEWGDGQVRVHTDAFLDLFNDEIGTFGLAPVEGERTFRVVADAYKNCFDETVPDASEKAFIKLRAHPRAPSRLKAYFSKHGGLAEEISSPNGLPWGSTDVCTMTVKWNTELPSQPYVELIRINGFSTWNP